MMGIEYVFFWDFDSFLIRSKVGWVTTQLEKKTDMVKNYHRAVKFIS